VRSERSGSKQSGAIGALLLVGLLLGGVYDGWIGSIIGGHQSDVAEAPVCATSKGAPSWLLACSLRTTPGSDPWSDPPRTGGGS